MCESAVSLDPIPAVLIDLGNSRLKWGLWQSGTLQVQPPIALIDSEMGDISPLLTAVPDALVWISSTALNLNDDLRDRLRKAGAKSIAIFRSPALGLGIRNAYAEPQKLGTDRFLAMAGARMSHQRAMLIADAGTALTLDLIDASGLHRGGLIVPGPDLMRTALHRGTAGVRSDAQARVSDFADNTTDAVWSGAVLSCAAIIEQAWHRATALLSEPVELVTCGGAIHALLPHLKIPHILEPDLVLQGLGQWANRASSSGLR